MWGRNECLSFGTSLVKSKGGGLKVEMTTPGRVGGGVVYKKQGQKGKPKKKKTKGQKTKVVWGGPGEETQ